MWMSGSHLNRAALSWCRWAVGSRWPRPACHADSGSRWSQRWNTRSQPWLTWEGARDTTSQRLKDPQSHLCVFILFSWCTLTVLDVHKYTIIYHVMEDHLKKHSKIKLYILSLNNIMKDRGCVHRWFGNVLISEAQFSQSNHFFNFQSTAVNPFRLEGVVLFMSRILCLPHLVYPTTAKGGKHVGDNGLYKQQLTAVLMLSLLFILLHY